MRPTAELNLALRVRLELPAGLQLVTEEFQDGWSFAPSVDAHRLEKRILTCGWNFIKIGDGYLRNGVGETSQEAIACALRLALRCINEHSNAVTFERIALTQYPWFFLAKVRANPYRIQQGVALPVSDDAGAAPTDFPRKWLPHQSAVLYPHSGSTMQMLNDMLALSAGTPERNQ